MENGDTLLEKNQVHVISFRKFKRLQASGGKWEDLLHLWAIFGSWATLHPGEIGVARESWKWDILFGENELGGFGSSLGFNQKTL